MQNIFKLRMFGHQEACGLCLMVLHQCQQYTMSTLKSTLCATAAEVSAAASVFHGVHPAWQLQGCGPASFKTSLVCSFLHLALEAVFKLVLAWVGLNLCLVLHFVDPHTQANALTRARVVPVQLCPLSVACLCLFPLQTNHQITVSLWWWAHTRKISCNYCPYS